MNITGNAIWLLGCRVAGDLLNLLLFVVISRQFGPAGAGAYSYGFAIAGFVFTLGCLGIEEYGLREYARMDAAHRPAFLAELLGTQAVMLTAAVLGVAIYLALTTPTAATVTIVAALGFYQMSAAIAATLFIPAMGHQRMMGPAVFDLLTRVVAFGITGISIYFGHASIATALLGFAVAGVVLLTLSSGSARRYNGPLSITISHHVLFKLSGVLWSFASIELFAQLFTRVGVIALTLKLSESAAGLYATGLRLTEVGLLPLSFMGVAAYPRLSQLSRGDPRAFRRVGRDLLWLTAGIGGFLAWGLYYVAPMLLVPVLGPKYAGTEPVIRIIAALALIQACEVVMGRLMLAADLQVARAVVFAVGAVTALILNIVLIPHFGISGTIYAGIVSYGVIVALYSVTLRRRLGLANLARVFLSFSASVIAAVVGAWAATSAGWPYWLCALSAIALFVAIAGPLFLLDHRRVVVAPLTRPEAV